MADGTPAPPPDPEYLDVVTATGVPIGSAGRDEVHRDGLWHPVFHCLVVRSGAPARVVLQRRAGTKASFARKLDLSATGHLRSGELPVDGVRELNEELGLDVVPGELTPIGTRLLADDGGEGRNRERVHLFCLRDDRPIDHFTPAADEVASVVEAEVDRLLSLLDGEPGPVEAIEWSPGRVGGPGPVSITLADLVDPIDGYWTVVLVMAKRFALDQGPLGI